jgi:hypothetical protein
MPNFAESLQIMLILTKINLKILNLFWYGMKQFWPYEEISI